MKKILHNKVFRFITFIIKTLFVIAISLYLLFIFCQRISGNKSIFGYRLFTIATGSMSGVYEINDVIAVKDTDIDTLKVGDDIAYRGSRGGLEGMLITHRIIKIDVKEDGEKIFVTKGVKAQVEDPSITKDQILGKVVGIVPFISFLNHMVKSQLGFFLLIFCPLVLIIVLEILQTITDIQLDNNEIQEINRKKSKNDIKKEENEVIEEQEIEIL